MVPKRHLECLLGEALQRLLGEAFSVSWAQPLIVSWQTGWNFVTSAHFAASCTTVWVAQSRNESWFGSPARQPHVGEHVLVTPQFLAFLNQPIRAQDGGVQPEAIVT